jgi:hypothetical protein
MNGIRISAATLIVAGLLAAPRCQASNELAATPSNVMASSSAGAEGVHVLVAPVLWVLGAIGVPVEAPAPLPNSQELARDLNARTLQFAVNDDGLGVYLEVAGRVEFEGAEVRLADGTRRVIPLRRVVRGRGLYELCDLGEMTRVEAVLVRAHARSETSRVGVRLGR